VTNSPQVTIQPATPSAAPAQSALQGSDAVVPKFDERMMAALVVVQEQHRGT
jgi:hypothetical protein